MANLKILSGLSVFFGVAGFTFILAALCTNNWIDSGKLAYFFLLP